jgi:hypothetical protein
MHLADFVGLAGVVENALGHSRLPGIDVGHDADITVAVERGMSCHDLWKLSLWKQLETAGAGGRNSTKTRVDHAPLNGTGIHPLPPGAPATISQVGTRGAPALP